MLRIYTDKKHFVELGLFLKQTYKNPKIKKAVNLAVMLFVIVLLVSRLERIGIGRVIESLPSQPLFYLASIFIFFTPIVTEIFIYRVLTGARRFRQISIFVRKQIYNEAIIKYAGELFLIKRLSEIYGLELKAAAIMVKDAALVRTFLANFWVLFLLGLVFFCKVMSSAPR